MEEKKPLLRRGYITTKLLGEGEAGRVMEAIKQTNPEQKYAVKIVKSSPKSVNEVLLHRLVMKHSNIVKIYEDWCDGDLHFIVQQYVGGGDLLKRVASSGPIPELQLRTYFVQLVKALLYIHEECSIVHRDLKLENILLSGCLSTIFLAEWDLA